MLQKILSDLVKINDILFVVRSNGVVSEIKSNLLNVRQKDNWITIGDNDGPCHMHINEQLIKKIKFVKEPRPERTSFSVQFFDSDDVRVLAAFFTKMYDQNKNLDQNRLKLFEDLSTKFGSILYLD